ncbi:MAG: efflux RND transporter periplasmic adaptor subunit [Woeseiaceae bacterium]|nr:efflux RND transporter periplasmic adaptor subunit [Gammaproteobacteria bacterium]NNF49352.1 efflux RND transporter periplasmic adaptor subunit [Woeseiaceae bacterium]NNK26476.1 efflux RND transporter periplasmic adaptor subunit [Woeseiaceae bacterium]NNL62610.1 efflux RND transporter periplasmic adaptor subunit [Woeseiaceae bacterium]
MKLFRIGWAALACIPLLAACQVQVGSDDNDESVAGEEEEESAPVPVETTMPVRGDVYAMYSGTAPIEAYAEADVIAKVEGEVRALLAEEGDEVDAGQVLARLDGDRLRLELNQSRANLAKLQRDFERNKELREKGLLSEGEFEKLRYDLEAFEASYNLARLELDYTRIRAPIDGVVSERYIKLGNTIRVGDPAYRVTSLDPLVTYLHIPEREFQRIAPGQPVAIEIDALPGEPFMATVTRVSPVVDPVTGTFKTTIEMRDEQRRIKPGMFGRMNIIYDRHENVLQIPRAAIFDERGEESVYVIEDDKAIRRPVQTGFGQNGMVEITAGLADADAVVTVGHVGLKNEATVIVINAEAEEEAAPAGDTDEQAAAEGDT